jgi:hypothetical protein
MSGLYSLRRANRSLRLAVILFLLVQGSGYVFAFLMVRTWAGLTPTRVAATYRPSAPVEPAALPATSSRQTTPVDLGQMGEESHTVDVPLLVQDSHVHLLMYAVIAAIQSVIVLGLEWPAWWRDTVIASAFASGAFDFAGQWLVKAGMPSFAWLTIASGWAMAAVYLVVLVGALTTVFGSRRGPGDSR